MTGAANMAWLTTQVPAELADDFKRLASDHDRSAAAELRKLVREHVDAHKAPPAEAAA